MLVARVRPEREVEDDPGAAGERQQREDEPDERDVDRRGSARCLRRPPRSPARQSSARSERSGMPGSSVRRASTRTEPDADVRVERRARACPVSTSVALDVAPVVATPPRRSTSPTSARRRAPASATPAGTMTREVADVDARLDVRLAGAGAAARGGRGRACRCRARSSLSQVLDARRPTYVCGRRCRCRGGRRTRPRRPRRRRAASATSDAERDRDAA